MTDPNLPNWLTANINRTDPQKCYVVFRTHWLSGNLTMAVGCTEAEIMRDGWLQLLVDDVVAKLKAARSAQEPRS